MDNDRFGSLARLRSDPASGTVLGVAGLVGVLLGAQLLLGASAIGLGVDDYTHVQRFDEWLRSGWYVPPALLVGGEPDPTRFGSTPYVYGAAFSVLAHLANVALGNEAIGEISTDADAYAVRHVVAALIGLGTVLCVGGAVWALTRDRLAAVWSGAALLAVPAWTGYAMFSNKDIPAAAAYTFITVALVLLLVWADRRPSPSWKRLLAPAALIAIGVFLGVGTRPAMWLPFLVSLAAFAALAWRLLGSIRGAGRALAAPATGFVVGLSGVLALHPRTAAEPIEWLTKSISESSEYGRPGVGTLTAGQSLSEFPPPWYLPAWTFAAVPVLVLLIAVLGAAVATHRAVRSRRQAAATPESSIALTGGVLLVALQLVLLPIAAIVNGSAMYSGLRQHLYVLPPIAILAGVGAARLLHRRREAAGPASRVGWIPALILCVALAVPAFEQTRLYPYNYVYVNPVAGIGGVDGRWETEHQWISAREAIRRVPAGAEWACSLWLGVTEPCDPYLGPFVSEVGDEAPASPRRGELWVVGRVRGGTRPPSNCQERDNVTRMLRDERLVMAYVLTCTPPPGN
jgi:hypothetical protein